MMQQQNQKDGTGDGEELQPDETGDMYGVSDSDGEGEGSKIVTAANCGGKLTDHNWEAGNDAEDAAAAVRELVK
jgi:hypothetical protein